MLGRAIFGNPWLFAPRFDLGELNQRVTLKDAPRVTLETRLRVLVEHTKLFEELLGGKKSFAIMKKHYKAYVSGWAGAKNLRVKLMMTYDSREVESIVHEYLKKI